MNEIRKRLAGFIVAVAAVMAGVCIVASRPVHAYSYQQVATWSELQDALNSGRDAILTQDITASSGDSALVIPATCTVKLNLNGHTIDRGLYKKSASGEVTVNNPQEDGYVIKVKGGLTLTIFRIVFLRLNKMKNNFCIESGNLYRKVIL